jgi:hypothetical protein
VGEELESAKERSWRQVAAIGAAHASGELDDDGWFAATQGLIVPAYLSASAPQGGSGSSRDEGG